MEFRMTPEIQAQLVGLMPLVDGATMPFTPPSLAGLPNEVRPIFKQRAFTRGERQEYEELMAASLSDDTIPKGTKTGFVEAVKWNNRAYELARLTVSGWEKVFDPASGKAVEFKADANGGADKDIFSGFNAVVKSEIFENARKISSLSQIEKQGLTSLPEST